MCWESVVWWWVKGGDEKTDIALTPDQEKLLSWIKENPRSQEGEMANCDPPAPGYTSERLIYLVENGLVTRLHSGATWEGHLVDAYEISEKGRAVIQKIADQRQGLARQEADKKRDLLFTIVAILISLLTFLAPYLLSFLL